MTKKTVNALQICMDGEQDMTGMSAIELRKKLRIQMELRKKLRTRSDFADYSLELVTRYVLDPEDLSMDETLRVEEWVEHDHFLKEEVAMARKNIKFLKGVTVTYSDV